MLSATYCQQLPSLLLISHPILLSIWFGISAVAEAKLLHQCP